MGLPRYMALAQLGDVQRTVALAEELADSPDSGPVCLVQCGQPTPEANAVARELETRGRRTKLLLLADREVARSERTLSSLSIASAAWVFADNLLTTFFEVFATPAAFVLRERAQEGLPVIGVGGGALALGGLLLAERVCSRSSYDLVTGLGWASRVLIDADLWEENPGPQLTHDSVRTLPGLLGLRLGTAGAVRVEGGHIESVGDEPVMMLGMDCETGLLQLRLQPGASVRIAPPPFAPFERGLLPMATIQALSAVEDARRARTPSEPIPLRPPKQAPIPPEVAPDPAEQHEAPGSGRKCPLCKQVHPTEAIVELAA
jgi:hypothetical protein